LRSRSTEEKAEATRKFIEDVLPLIAEGKIKPNLEKVFPVEALSTGQKQRKLLESLPLSKVCCDLAEAIS
jgi:NADPH:quinone reductase-like Zn-dependent oxidoreductase